MAAADWQNSGIQLKRGQRYQIRATGYWSIGPICGETDASGAGIGIFCAGDPWDIGVTGSTLIGRIGEEGVIFPVRNHLELTARRDGALYFMAYDMDILRFDNSGSLTVRITEIDPSSESQVAALSPGVESFDGEWLLVILGQRIRLNVIDQKFTARFANAGWRGEINGTIDETGMLTASGTARKMYGNDKASLKYIEEYSGT